MSTKFKETNQKINFEKTYSSKSSKRNTNKVSSLYNTDSIYNTTNYKTQNNFLTTPSKSFYNNQNSLEDINKIITNINNEVMVPLKKEIKKKNKNNEHLKKNVNALQSNVKVLNNALNATDTQRNNIIKKNRISISKRE